jgi:excisionase family DNA binding protein
MRKRSQEPGIVDSLGGPAIATQRWISVDEAEDLTGLSKWSWRRLAYAQRIGSSKVGRRLVLKLSDVQSYMEAGYRPAAGAR